MLRFLLEQGFRPDAGLAEGWHTILGKLAAEEETDDNRMVIQLLLERGADPNAVPPAKQDAVPPEPALHGALRNGRFKHAALLLDNGARLDPDGVADRPSVLHLALASRQPGAAAVKKLIDHGAKVNAGGVVRNENRSKASLASPATPLQFAVDLRDWDSAKVLIAHGADLKQPGLLSRYLPERAFGSDQAAEQKRIDEKESEMHLLDLRADREQPRIRMTERLKFLLEAGTDPNILDPRGYHPLSLVVLAGRVDLLELLLKHGADPNIVFGKDPGELPPPPQRAAAEMRNAPGLLNYAFNPDWRVETCTPEVQAAMLRLLLKAGAKPGPHAPTLLKVIEGHDPDGSLARALGAEVPADSTPPPDQHQ